MQYLAFVQRGNGGGYVATLPDFPGCHASAASWLSLEPAIRDAVRVHVREQGTRVPPPTPIELFTEDSAPADACWMEVNLFQHEVTPPRRRRGRSH